MPRKKYKKLKPERGKTDTRTQDWDPLEWLRLIVHTLFEEKIWTQNKRGCLRPMSTGWLGT